MKTITMAAFLTVLATTSAWAFTKSGTSMYKTDGSQADVQAAINAASAGNTVSVPAGTFTWGASGSFVNVSKAITLAGAGTDKTFISESSTGGAYNGVCRIFSSAPGAVVRDMTFNSPTSGNAVAAFTTGGGNGWRISNIQYNYNGGGTYFVYAGTYGLIDNCTINNPSASGLELIFLRGPTNSWQTPSSMGTQNAVYVEDCTFNAVGYVCDANANARIAVRNCTMTLEGIKIDGHGKASNSPPRGVRQVESYRNRWTQTSTNKFAVWYTHELRGGTGMIWGNTELDNSYFGRGILRLTDYSITAAWANFSKVYQTPVNYPIDDQVGVGQDPKVGGSEPMYLWGNTKAGSPMSYNFASAPGPGLDLYQAQLGYSCSTTAQAVVGVPFTYLFGASASPTYDATDLPPGLSFKTSTTAPNAVGIPAGMISGTPTTAGTYTINLSATNQKGTFPAVLTLVVGNTPDLRPRITSVASQYAFVNGSFTYQLAGTNVPTSYAASDLPAGLVINSSTGVISGKTTAAAGNYQVSVSVSNAVGTTKGVLTICVLAPGTTSAPIINDVYFTVADIIKADRDYFSGDTLKGTFDGSSGVGEGTYAQMQAIQPATKGVGFWVTDRGTWDTTNKDGNGKILPSGQLYTWDGTTWVLKYMPLTYPHPLRNSSADSASLPPAPQDLRRQG